MAEYHANIPQSRAAVPVGPDKVLIAGSETPANEDWRVTIRVCNTTDDTILYTLAVGDTAVAADSIESFSEYPIEARQTLDVEVATPTKTADRWFHMASAVGLTSRLSGTLVYLDPSLVA